MRPKPSRAARAAPPARKDERVELRTTAEEKRLLVAAASHEHLDVTAFVLRSVLPAARDVIDRAGTTTLSARDTARVLDLLEHPPAPTDRLRRAAAALRTNDQTAERAGPSVGAGRARRRSA